MKTTTITIDLAKTVFQAALFNKHGVLKSNKKYTDSKLRELVAQHPEAVISMEACGTAHDWGRYFQKNGHQVKLIPAHIVAKYRTGNKNDMNDALAIFEALKRPNTYFVKVKTLEQQDLAVLLRLRQGYIKQQTQIANRARGLGMEYGIKIPKTINQLKASLPLVIADETNELTSACRFILRSLLDELYRVRATIKAVTTELEMLAKHTKSCVLLTSLPGVAWIVAAGLYARLGDGSAYQRGRDASASIGLVPRHSGTGGNNKILGITKRGDRYLRSLVVHGARAVACNIRDKQDKLSCWIRDQSSRNHLNKTTVALANKLVRMALAILKSSKPYKPSFANQTMNA
jgi:transposase